MPDLVVVGLTPGPPAADVAAAVCAGLDVPEVVVAGLAGPGSTAAVARLDDVAVVAGDAAVFETAASPFTAARHAGQAIRPVAPAAGSGSVRVVVAGGGLLALLTARFSVRDLAVSLRAPVVLAVPAGVGATAQVLLALEGCRSAALRVAAIVLTGWPDPPSRVLTDERALLTERAGVPVEVLGDAPVDWPVLDWLREPTPDPDEAEPADAPAASAAPTTAALEPYRAWDPKPQGDPRATPRPTIMAVLEEIVGAEGPMTASRAYGLYNRAAGGKKLTTIARAPLSSAMYWLAREGRVELQPKDEIPWQDDDVVRPPDAPEVRVRELGPRALEEVPLDEIAELARRVRQSRPRADDEAVKRAVLRAYGLRRLTSRTDDYLTTALELAA